MTCALELRLRHRLERDPGPLSDREWMVVLRHVAATPPQRNAAEFESLTFDVVAGALLTETRHADLDPPPRAWRISA